MTVTARSDTKLPLGSDPRENARRLEELRQLGQYSGPPWTASMQRLLDKIQGRTSR